MRKINVYPNQRVITTSGEVATVATIAAGRVYVYAANGWLKAVDVVSEAWGGEHDMNVANAV